MREDRALFHKRGVFAAIAIGILALLLSLAGLAQLSWKHAHEHTFCESYSPGFPPRGCTPEDNAAWRALGVRPLSGAASPRP